MVLRSDTWGGPRWVCETRTTALLAPLGNQFYKPWTTLCPELRQRLQLEGVKGGPGTMRKRLPDNIGLLLDPRALAYWYMDDGSINDRKSGACILNTQSFTWDVCVCLCNALYERFNIQAQIRDPRRKHKLLGHQIYVKTNKNCFQDLIKTHILECARYKLPRRVRVVGEQ